MSDLYDTDLVIWSRRQCLRRTVADVIAEELRAARSEAAASLADNGETPRVAIDGVVHSEDQVLGDWLP